MHFVNQEQKLKVINLNRRESKIVEIYNLWGKYKNYDKQ